MQKPLAQIFNETAAAAYEAFPQELKDLVIFLVPSADTPVFVSPSIAGQLTKSTRDIREAVIMVTEAMRANAWVGVACRDFILAGTPVNLIALDNEKQRADFSRRYTKKMHMVFVLDHEIGHHILRNGRRSRKVSQQQAESAAEAFAMLRHIQRFGKNTAAGAESERLAHRIVLCADMDHYTTDSFQRAIQVAEEMDISGLSLRETAALAEKIAAECHLDIKTLRKIRNAFSPVYKACRTQIGDIPAITNKFYEGDKRAYDLFCREALAVMKRHKNDADIFKAGKRFLNYAPVRKFMMASAESDPHWQRAISFMDNHAPTQRSTPHNVRKPG